MHLPAQQQMGSFMAYGAEAKYFSNLNYRVYQGADGYLWFGTLNGLVRFDGKHYKNYFSDYTNPNSPSDNTIVDITEDKNGDLWFAGFYHGATKYNKRSGRFTKYASLTKDNNPYYGIYQLLNDARGNLWFGTAGRGLAKYNFENDSFQLFYPEPSFPADGSVRGYNFVTCMAPDPVNASLLWIGTFHGLFSFNTLTGQFIPYPSGLKMYGQIDILIHALQFDKNNFLWIGTWGHGLNCFDVKTLKFLPAKRKTAAGVVYDLKKINDSTIYAACLNDGLYSLHTNTGSFVNITPPRNPADPASLQPNIQKVSVTPDAGVFAGGNYYVYQQHAAYSRLKKNIFFPSSKKTKGVIVINSFVWDKNRQQYWIATIDGNGLYSLDKDAAKITALTYPEIKTNSVENFHDLIADAKSRIWVIGKNGLLLWDDVKKSFVKGDDILSLPDSVKKNITRLATTKQGDVWMISNRNFILWEIQKNRTSSFFIDWDKEYKGEKLLKNFTLLASPDETAWLLTTSGMFHCIPQQKKVKHIFKTGDSKTNLSSAIVKTGAFNKNNDLWITSGNGIQVFKWENYAVRANHMIDKGLPSMSVNSIATDSAGRVWAGTAAGLGLFDPSKKIWQLFNRLDGLEKDYLDGNIFVSADNKIIIDQQNGFLIKNISEVIPKVPAPQLKLTALFINKKELQNNLLPEYISKLVLPYDSNNVDLEFAAMDWIYPFKTSYRYKIEGIASDSSWMPNPDCRISLTGLQPGKYVVHIRALISNANWSNELIFSITVKPPFYKTWWFIFLCTAVVFLMLYALYRYRINNFLQMQKVRNAISRDLHDEIGATLSSVNMLSAVALIKAGENNDAKPIIEQIKNSVQQAGESIDDIVWSVNPANDKASDTFARIRKYITEIIEARGVNCMIDIEETQEDRKLDMEMRRDLYLICKEAVNNALKYAACTEINLQIKVKSNNLQLHIADNGKGFDTSILPDSQRNGIGNMKHRVAKHNGSFSIHSQKNKGTAIDCVMKF